MKYFFILFEANEHVFRVLQNIGGHEMCLDVKTCLAKFRSMTFNFWASEIAELLLSACVRDRECVFVGV